jgi:hypothetical protein
MRQMQIKKFCGKSDSFKWNFRAVAIKILSGEHRIYRLEVRSQKSEGILYKSSGLLTSGFWLLLSERISDTKYNGEISPSVWSVQKYPMRSFCKLGIMEHRITQFHTYINSCKNELKIESESGSGPNSNIFIKFIKLEL